jgi:hypothetical protein
MGFFLRLMADLKIFRVAAADELKGLDDMKHEGAVYSNKSWSMMNESLQVSEVKHDGAVNMSGNDFLKVPV